MKIKKGKGTKTCFIKRKNKFGNCLEATQLEHKINILPKSKTYKDSFK